GVSIQRRHSTPTYPRDLAPEHAAEAAPAGQLSPEKVGDVFPGRLRRGRMIGRSPVRLAGRGRLREVREVERVAGVGIDAELDVGRLRELNSVVCIGGRLGTPRAPARRGR